MDWVKVSIIVPVYNAAEYLEECIESLVHQSFESMEVILVNDGSSDNSQEIIELYHKKYPGKVKYIVQENAGPSKTRNNGLSIAQGEYVGFIDADDFLELNAIEIMYNNLIDFDSDLVVCGYYNLFTNRDRQWNAKVLPEKKIYNHSIFEQKWLLSSTSPFVWDKLFKMNIIKEHNLRFPEGIDYGEDQHFLSRYKFFAKKITCVEEPLYYYRVKGDNSITGSYSVKILDLIKSHEEICEFYLERGEFNRFKAQLYNMSAGCMVRRINDFENYRDKKLQKEIANSFFAYMDEYFHGWRKSIISYKNRNILSKLVSRHRGNRKLLQLYIATPNSIKRPIRASILEISNIKGGISRKIKKMKRKFTGKIKKMKRKFNGLKKAINKNRILYSYYRKKHKVSENKVLFISYFGSSISGNIYYMMEDLLRDSKFEIYAGTGSIPRDDIFIKFNNIQPRLVKIHSREYVKLLATAKYIVIDSRLPDYFSKRSGQYFMNTWHGTPLKTLGRKMLTGLKDIGNNQGNFLMADLLLFPNEYTKNHMMEDYFLEDIYSGMTIVNGYPRNSVFFDQSDVEDIKEKMGIKGKKVYVYMPTWRGSTLASMEVEKYQTELIEMLEKIDAELNDDVIMFVKLHQVVMRKIKLHQYKHIKMFHPQYETYHFLNIADCLITDYSSVFFDYANTKKEIILFMYDYEDYCRERGMYIDIKELPFTTIYNTDDLLIHINNNTEFTFTREYSEFLDKYCQYDSSNNPKEINQAFFYNTGIQDLSVTDYKANKYKKFDVFIMSNLEDEYNLALFHELLRTMDENTVFAFHQKTFSEVTNNILHAVDSKKLKYLILQGSMPVTIGEIFAIQLFRKMNIFGAIARKIYVKEIERLFPNMKINKIVNYTTISKYKDIEKLFKNGV